MSALRAVAANETDEERRVEHLERIYDVFRRSLEAGLHGTPLDRLGEELGCELLVFDGSTGRRLFAAATADTRRLGAQIRRVFGETGQVPTALPLRDVGRDTVALPVPGSRGTALVARSTEQRPRLFLLQHTATMIGIVVERVMAEHDRERRRGAELVTRLRSGAADVAGAREALGEHGLGAGPWLVVAYAAGHDRDARPLDARFGDAGIAAIVLDDEHPAVAVIADGGDELADVLAEGGRAGLSDPVNDVRRFPDAAREAQLALAATRSGPDPVARYGATTSFFLPRTMSEARATVDQVLGPAVAYDRRHGTDLIASLQVLLEENRSWVRSAERLHVHKGTLVYRMTRLEELTGYTLTTTADVAKLWLALQALAMVGAE
jgi:purine catabolism regulator